jgi:hypothetical protein
MDSDQMNAAIDETLRRIQGLSDGTVSAAGKIDAAFQQTAGDINRAFQTVDQMKTGNMAGGLEGIGRAVNALTPQIKSLGSDLATLFGDNKLGEDMGLAIDALDHMGSAAAGVGQIMLGDVSGVQNLISGASKLISVFNSLGDQESKNLQKRIEHYGRVISLYDRLIEKQKELLGSLSGQEAVEASQKAAGLIDKQMDAEQVKMESWFKQKNGHSNAYKFNQSWQNFTDKDVLAYKAEDWEKLREQAELWDRLPKEVQNYGTAVVEAKEKTAELAEITREAFTGFSFDNFSQSFLDTLIDMDSSVEDFAENMEKSLQKAILNSLIDDK